MSVTKINKIAVLTSGGDAPGMNAAIRSVVNTATYYKMECVGVIRGYNGLINGDFTPLNRNVVGNIIQRGGTVLKTARSQEFFTKEGRQKAYQHLKAQGVDAMVVIGGDGTFTGAKVFMSEHDFPIVGLPGTIDNDLVGTDFTIGYDTAINTVVDAIDKIRDTAESHDRIFIVEVMGRDSGLIALRSGIAVGAESILIPEARFDTKHVLKQLEMADRNDKTSRIVIVAEGRGDCNAFEMKTAINQKFPTFDVRVSVLGHIQRGGKPSAMDRVYATRMGVGAVEALIDGHKGEMIGLVNQRIKYTAFEDAIKHINVDEVGSYWVRMMEVLSM